MGKKYKIYISQNIKYKVAKLQPLNVIFSLFFSVNILQKNITLEKALYQTHSRNICSSKLNWIEARKATSEYFWFTSLINFLLGLIGFLSKYLPFTCLFPSLCFNIKVMKKSDHQLYLHICCFILVFITVSSIELSDPTKSVGFLNFQRLVLQIYHELYAHIFVYIITVHIVNVSTEENTQT